MPFGFFGRDVYRTWCHPIDSRYEFRILRGSRYVVIISSLKDDLLTTPSLYSGHRSFLIPLGIYVAQRHESRHLDGLQVTTKTRGSNGPIEIPIS